MYNILCFSLFTYSFHTLILYNMWYAPISYYVFFTSSSIDLLCVSTFSGYIYDYSTSIGFHLLLFLILNYLWLIIFLTFSLSIHGSLECTSSWVVPLGPSSFSSSWSDVLVLVGLPHIKFGKVIRYTSRLYLYVLSLTFCFAKFSSKSLKNIHLQLPTILQILHQIFHFAPSFHESIILQHLVIIFQFLHTNWIQIFLPFIYTFQLCLQLLQIPLMPLICLHQLFYLCLYCCSYKLCIIEQRSILQVYQL